MFIKQIHTKVYNNFDNNALNAYKYPTHVVVFVLVMESFLGHVKDEMKYM